MLAQGRENVDLVGYYDPCADVEDGACEERCVSAR